MDAGRRPRCETRALLSRWGWMSSPRNSLVRRVISSRRLSVQLGRYCSVAEPIGLRLQDIRARNQPRVISSLVPAVKQREKSKQTPKTMVIAMWGELWWARARNMTWHLHDRFPPIGPTWIPSGLV